MVPPLEAAIPTMAAVVSAMKRSSALVHPSSRYTRQVSSSVATTMPEMGLDEEPISPVIRALTVTKKKPHTTISTADRRLMCSGGASQMASTRSTLPTTTTVMGRSCSVRSITGACPLPREAMKVSRPRRKASTMVGSERMRLMRPPVATAPAPMYSTYASRTVSGSMFRMSVPSGA